MIEFREEEGRREGDRSNRVGSVGFFLSRRDSYSAGGGRGGAGTLSKVLCHTTSPFTESDPQSSKSTIRVETVTYLIH